MEMPSYNLDISSEFELARLDILECIEHGNIDTAMNILDDLSPSSQLQLLEKRVREELLRKDAYDAYSQMFDVKALVQWVYQNPEHAVNHCPHVMEVFGASSPYTASHLMAQYIKNPEELRKAFYTSGGVVHLSVPSFMRSCMAEKSYAQSFWQSVNPFWMGAPDSVERTWATEHYFDMQCWPKMVWNYLFTDASSLEQPIYNTSTWLSWGPMPYTLGLIQHLQDPSNQFRPMKAIGIPVNTDPWDACVAQAIVEHLPTPNVRLSFPSLKCPNEALLLEKAKHIVSIYAGLDAWDNLKQAALNKTLDPLLHTHTIESFEFAFQHQP